MTGNPIIPFKVPLNDARSNLASAVASGAGTITVTTGEGGNFPATADGDFWVSIDQEILLCTSRAVDVLTVTRGQQSTVDANHDAGASVELRITQEAFEDIHANVVKGVLQGWAEFGDHGGPGVSIGTIPANGFVYRVNIWVHELFDAGNRTLNVGYDAATPYYVDTFDISGAVIDNVDDDGHADAGAGIGVVDAVARACELYIDAAGCATGKVYVAVHYIVADAIP